jgi:hypothetical protein
VESTTYFLAFTPNRRLYSIIQGYKDQVAKLVGPQLYLSDPPHLTIYLSTFPTSLDIQASFHELQIDRQPPMRVTGWHSWIGDPLTAQNTLVCDLHPDSAQWLRCQQQAIVRTFAPLRDSAASELHYRSRWGKVSTLQQSNIVLYGFPFLDDDWHPHLTIASIMSTDWDVVINALSPTPPHGEFAFGSLDLYELKGIHPIHRHQLILPQ